MNTCKTCKYYEVTHNFKVANAGICHRYPITAHVYDDEWCGEYEQD